MRAIGALALIPLGLLTACSGSTSEPEELVVLQEPLATVPAAEIQGTLRHPGSGCWLLGESLVVWPEGAQSDGNSVTLADGRTFGDGDQVSGSGGEIPLEQISVLATVPESLECEYVSGTLLNPLSD
ncbi:MAG: hypothetical protein Q4G64_01695 [bacterium]|nr:hypothetical protein [bacterium]